MRKANEHTTDYTTERWDYDYICNAPTWKVVVWFVMIMVVIAVMWVYHKLTNK